MTFPDALSMYDDWMQLRRLAPRTRQGYRAALALFVTFAKKRRVAGPSAVRSR